MIRISTVIAVPCLIIASSSGLAQTSATPHARAAYAKVVAVRDSMERGHGHFVAVNGIRMHYLAWGDAKGVPLVWAHGSGSDGYELRHVAPRLAEAGYRVLAVDYRGHGQTRVKDVNFGIYHIADDLVAMLDSLRIRAAVFGGASKGGSVAAAVYDQYPTRVLGLLMADGGTWSLQYMYDRETPEQIRQSISDPLPQIFGTSELEVFEKIVGDMSAEELQKRERSGWTFDMLRRIGRNMKGEWAFLPDFEALMGKLGMAATTMKPTMVPPLQWSENAMIPRMMFRNLHVPMMIIDPQSERDARPVTDQNLWLVEDHPKLVIHRVYPETGHNVLNDRPDSLVRDAIELLDRVRKRSRQ
jgi:pimeloyl-ACP methyl ester carboxylesterase